MYIRDEGVDGEIYTRIGRRSSSFGLQLFAIRDRAIETFPGDVR